MESDPQAEFYILPLIPYGTYDQFIIPYFQRYATDVNHR